MRAALITLFIAIGPLAVVGEAQENSIIHSCASTYWARFGFSLPRAQHVDFYVSMQPVTDSRRPSFLVALYDERKRDENQKRQMYWWTTERVSHSRIGLRGSRYTLWVGCTESTLYSLSMSTNLPTTLHNRSSVGRLERLTQEATGLDYPSFIQRVQELEQQLKAAEEAGSQ